MSKISEKLRVDLIKEGLVFIKEITLPKLRHNYVFNENKKEALGDWETTLGFKIKNPVSGFVSKEYWGQIKEFQEIPCPEFNIACSVMFLDSKNPTPGYTKIPKEELLKIPDVVRWFDLQDKSNSFINTVEEFYILIGRDSENKDITKRADVLLGIKSWIEVE